MTEEFALDQFSWDRSTIQRYKWGAPSEAGGIDKSGNELFSRPGLAGQEDGNVRLCNGLRPFQNALQPRRLGDDISVRDLGLYGLKPFQLPQKIDLSKHPVHNDRKGLTGNGLFKIVIRPMFQGLDLSINAFDHTDDDHLDRRINLSYFGEEIQSALLVAKSQIEQDQVRLDLLVLGEALFLIFCQKKLTGLSAQHFAVEGPIIFVVFNNENLVTGLSFYFVHSKFPSNRAQGVKRYDDTPEAGIQSLAKRHFNP